MDYRERIRQAALDEATFLSLTLSGPLDKGASPWLRVHVRPVEVQGERRLQFSYFDATKDVTKNFSREEAAGKLDELLATRFSHLEMQSTTGDLHARITKKGKVLVSEGKPSRPDLSGPRLEHDRAKRRALAEDDPLWRALGLAGKDGRVLPSARGKFTQVNEFLRLLDEALEEASSCAGGHPRAAPRCCLRGRRGTGGHIGPPLQTVHILDAGCGSAYLTFAAARHLGDARIIGVDSNAELIGKCVATRDRLGGGAIDFRVSSIAQFEPEAPVDVVLSLHACDTATDEALAKGVQWKSRVILAAPCCQHELHRKLGTLPHFRVGEEQSKGPCGGNEGASLISFAPVLRHGLLRERLADILTDAFRALALKVMGYRVQVVEFVSPEHTSKNLMLRAVRAHVPGNSQAVAEYLALKDFWHVTPAIETLLGDEFRRRVAR